MSSTPETPAAGSPNPSTAFALNATVAVPPLDDGDDVNEAIRSIAENDQREYEEESDDAATPFPPSTNPAPSNTATSHSPSSPNQMRIGRPLTEERVAGNADTTARKKSKHKEAKKRKGATRAAIGKGKRVKICRSALKLVVKVDSPAWAIIEHNSRNDFNFFGTVLAPKQKNGKYNVRFDLLPEDDNEYAVVRDRLTVLHSGEDERAFDYANELSAEIAEACGGVEKEKKISAAQKAIDAFLSLPDEEKKSAKSFAYPYGSQAEEVINWTILE